MAQLLQRKALSSDGWTISSMRLMQMTLATTVLLSLICMYHFASLSVSVDDSRQNGRLRDHAVLQLQGFEAGSKFVREYDVEAQGPLYLLFMSDADENSKYWCPDCE